MIISCIVAVGKNGGIAVEGQDLPWSIPEDIKYFREVTEDKVVIMGRKTFFSIPEKHRPLKNRLNIVITNKKHLYMDEYIDKTNLLFGNYVECMDYLNSSEHVSKYSKECVIIGGQEVYNQFKPFISKIYLTEINHHKQINYTHFFFKIPNTFKIIDYSPLHQHNEYLYRFLTFERDISPCHYHDMTYLKMCQKVLHQGHHRDDRTGTGTVAIFAEQMKFDLSSSIPILTTKRVPWKSCIEELLWFLRGDTNAKILDDKGVKIWNKNSTRDFLDGVGLTHLNEGDCGANYSFQWRHFGADYVDCNTSYINQGIDQIARIEDLLKNDRHNRRIFLSAWNPCDLNRTVLPPCHVSAQFFVDNNNGLHCHMYQRSCDMFLGVPWNILSYSILTRILAMRSDLKPGSLTISTGDTHIYKDHLEQVSEQMSRECLSSPILLIDETVKTKNIEDITIDDFEMIGYLPHSAIKANMSA